MTFVRDLLVVLALALAWAGPLSPAVAAEPLVRVRAQVAQVPLLQLHEGGWDGELLYSHGNTHSPCARAASGGASRYARVSEPDRSAAVATSVRPMTTPTAISGFRLQLPTTRGGSPPPVISPPVKKP